jgi:hypothetical protein
MLAAELHDAACVLPALRGAQRRERDERSECPFDQVKYCRMSVEEVTQPIAGADAIHRRMEAEVVVRGSKFDGRTTWPGGAIAAH